MSELDEFKHIFFTEAGELMAEMEERLLKLDEGSQDMEQLNAIFRCAHSIKGGSGAFGLDRIMRFTHKLEALLDAMRSGVVVPSRGSIDALLRSVDIVNQMLGHAQENREPADGFGDAVVAQLEQFAQGAGSPAPVALAPVPVAAVAASGAQQTYRLHFAPHKHLLVTGNEPLLMLRELARLGTLNVTVDAGAVPQLNALEPATSYLRWDMELTTDAGEDAVREVFEFVTDLAELTIELLVKAPFVAAGEPPIPAATLSREPAPEAPKAAQGPAVASSIRVDIEKIDRLVNMVGELVITEAMLRAQVRDLPDDKFSDLLRGMDELSQHTRELQEAVMAVRMQPVKSIFSRMPRIVRDTAGQLGKDVQLITSGEQTEVDKTVIELLGDRQRQRQSRRACGAAGRDGDGVDREIVAENFRHYQRDRRDRLPDQPAGAECGSGGGACR